MPSSTTHPNPLERNAAILWARDLLNRQDWIIASIQPSGDTIGGGVLRAVLIDGNGTTLLDLTDGFRQLVSEVKTIADGRELVFWNSSSKAAVLEEAAAAAYAPPVEFHCSCAMAQYKRFIGATEAQSNDDLPAATPQDGCEECKSVLEVIYHLAGSNQTLDSALSDGDWSSTFYKPRLTPTDKIKSFFGL